jgi:hypothetical protein
MTTTQEQQLLQQQCSRQLIQSVCKIIIILISTLVAGQPISISKKISLGSEFLSAWIRPDVEGMQLT